MEATTDPKGSVRTEGAGAELLVRQVRDALASLYDLPYLQSHPLGRLLPRPSSSEPTALGQVLQHRLLDAIELLRPGAEAPMAQERAARRYDLLRLRYVEGLDVPTICRHLGCSRSDYYRQLRQGLEAIAAHLESEFMSGSGPIPLLMSGGYQTPLVGREQELELLKAAYIAAASGNGGSIVMITGEQGVGKTRLAQELGHWVRLQGGLFLEGRWAAWEGAAPYGAVAESLRRGLRQLDPEEVALLVGPYGRDLARLFPDVVEHFDAGADATQLSLEEQQLRLYEGVGTVVYNLSQKQPLVMFLDDLHLAPHLELQLHIARRLKESRLLIVDAYREDELVERPALVAGRNELIRSRLVTEARLAPLTEAETGRMIAYAFGDTAAAQLQAPTYAINRGNPFFVEEMIRYLIENKAVRRVQDRWEVLEVTRVGIPESVKLLVQERVARLGEGVVTMLQQAAVLGQEFSFAAISLMADRPEDQLVEMHDQAMAAGLLVDRTLSATEEQYSFREDHVREALYQSIPATRRRRYHMQAGHALNTLYPHRLEELAYHFTHGSDATMGATYSYQAAEINNSLFNWGRAVPLYQDALDLWEEIGGHLDERAAAAESVGNACYKSGVKVQHAVGYFQQALSFYQELGNHHKAATIHSQLGREHMHSANLAVQDLAVALEHFHLAKNILDMESEGIPHGLVYCGVALAHLDRLDLTDAVSWSRRALELGEQIGSPAVVANACAPLGSAMVHSAIAPAREALERGWETSLENRLGFQADLSRACGARVLGVALKDPRAGLDWVGRGSDYQTTYSLFDIPS
ncbi:MAG: AAA family ATPase, partial [Chloroflexi bacterium]|nr:AAA family ATPase [Chloroflexota bacterium]